MKSKVIIIAFLIYLSGCFCSYLVCRADIRLYKHKYTAQDRATAMAFSSLSWLTFTAVGLMYLGRLINFDSEKPVNW